MAITVQGVKLKQISVGFDDQGIMKLEGSYELMSNTGMVLAKNNFNGYSEIKVGLNPVLAANLNTVVDGVKEALNKTLGLE